MNETGQITVILISILIAMVFFLLIREIICWYYKINTRIELQTETNSLLKELVKKSENKIAKINNSDISEAAFQGDKDKLKKALEELKG